MVWLACVLVAHLHAGVTQLGVRSFRKSRHQHGVEFNPQVGCGLRNAVVCCVGCLRWRWACSFVVHLRACVTEPGLR
jgi:hypothetical protein